MTGDEFVPCKDGYVIPHMPEDVPAGRAHVSRVMTGVVGDEWARNVGWMVSDYKEGLLGKSSSRQQGLVKPCCQEDGELKSHHFQITSLLVSK